MELVAAVRERDEIAGRLRRCGSGHVVESAVECVESGLYHERAHALLEVDQGRVTLSEHTHPSTTPPSLAGRLAAVEVVQRPRGGRWRAAETSAALSAAVALGEHQRLIALLDGPEGAAELEGLDRRLGTLARAARAAGGALVVVGLNGGHDFVRSVDLARELPAALPPELAARVRVHVEDGHARVDLCRPTLAGRAAIEDAIQTLAGYGTSLFEQGRGILLATAAPGVDLTGESPEIAACVAGRDPGDPHMSGAVFGFGAGVPRLAVPELSALELSRLLGELWRRGPAGTRWPR
jgi:hypothetical protein